MLHNHDALREDYILRTEREYFPDPQARPPKQRQQRSIPNPGGCSVRACPDERFDLRPREQICVESSRLCSYCQMRLRVTGSQQTVTTF